MARSSSPQCCHPTLANSDAYDVALANQSCGQDVGGLWKTPDRAGRRPGSDLKPHGNDRLGYHPQAGVVVAGVPADESVSLGRPSVCAAGRRLTAARDRNR
jgi:hypothetical protein